MRRCCIVILLLMVSAALASAQDADRDVQGVESETEAEPEGRPTLRRGACYVSGYSGGSGFAARARIDGGTSEAKISLQSLNISIAGGYFVADQVAVGPEVRTGFSRLVDQADNVSSEFELALGIQGAYFLELPDSRWVPMSRLSVAYERKSVRDDGQVDDVIENGFSVSPKLGINYSFSNRFTAGAEAVYSFSRRSRDGGEVTIVAHAVGLGLGIMVFPR